MAKQNLEQKLNIPNMKNYDKTYKNFDWKDIEKEFSWHKTGKVNMAYEAIDRHVDEGHGDRVAFEYSSDDRREKYTYADMKDLSNKFGNVLKKYGIKKGDRVFVFMPRSPELYTSTLGILKRGAVCGPLFEALMEEGLKDRVGNSGAKAIITTPELLYRINREKLQDLEHVIVVGPKKGRPKKGEINYKKEMKKASKELDITWVDREDPMLLHYTSGSTGKPKGVVHVHNAMIQHYMTAKYVLDLKPGDKLWCTADPGWVTGTSYGMFGPWLNGATSFIKGGRFDAEKWYETLANEDITVWFSAPTAFRLLKKAGGDVLKKYDLKKLRKVYSVGEPLNPEVIKWGKEALGKTIRENWWMTETGGMIIANYPSLEVRPGSMGKPFPGIEAAIIDDNGKELPAGQVGNLAIKAGWPSMMRQIWKNPEKYASYFKFKPWYISGDAALKDKDGYFWFQGRTDDIISTAGERVSPFEVESGLLLHPAVAEAGVIGSPDEIRGEIVKAYISLKPGYKPSDELKKEIRNFFKNNVSAYCAPRAIEFMESVPKNSSGKIMRRVLRAWDRGEDAGDLSTMEK